VLHTLRTNAFLWRTFYPLNPLIHNGYCTYNLLKTEPHHLPIDIIASAFRTIIRTIRTNREVFVMEYSVFSMKKKLSF